MSEEAMQVIDEYGDFFLTENRIYLRMFGGSKTPYLLPKYATDYIIHKEAVRQVFIDEVGHFLFSKKKAVYPPLPFKLGSHSFTNVKQAPEFIEELEKFHFGEMTFRRNDTHERMAEHCRKHKVFYEYTHHFDNDESVFRRAPNMTALNKRFKPKHSAKGGKGSEQEKAEQAKEEETARRIREEAQRLEEEATEWLRKGEEEKRKAAQDAAEWVKETAREAEKAAKQVAEEAQRKLDEELRKQEAENTELTQQQTPESQTEQG